MHTTSETILLIVESFHLTSERKMICVQENSMRVNVNRVWNMIR